MTAIYLNPADVPSHLRAGYTGKQFKAEACERVYIPEDAGLWSGGTRSTYQAIRLSDGAGRDAVNHSAAPWDGTRKGLHVDLKPGFAIVRHSMFCGRDMGLTFYVHPSDAAALLPAPSAELGTHAAIVIGIICGIKSAYRADYYRRAGLSNADVTAAKAELLAKGMINKSGAATVAGRNARNAIEAR